MNIIGRFFAYKAMNAAWRSATKLDLGALNAGNEPVTHRERAERRKMYLVVLLSLVLLPSSVASCVSGTQEPESGGLIGLGFVLFGSIFIAPLVIAFLPDRWFIGRRLKASSLPQKEGLNASTTLVNVNYRVEKGDCPGGCATDGACVCYAKGWTDTYEALKQWRPGQCDDLICDVCSTARAIMLNDLEEWQRSTPGVRGHRIPRL